jgi:enoyl-CoA hydratase
MIMLGRTVAAEEAAAIGLIHRIVDDEIVAAALKFTQEFSSYSLIALGLARDAVVRALDVPIHEGLKIEADLSTLAFSTADAEEGMAAFTERRKAVFSDE